MRQGHDVMHVKGLRGPILSLTDEHNSSAVDGWHNPERIRKEDFRSLHIASAILARMSSDAAEEPAPKGHAHEVTLQRVLELSCAIVSLCKVKPDYLEATYFHEFFGSDGSSVAPLEHRHVFGASPPPCGGSWNPVSCPTWKFPGCGALAREFLELPAWSVRCRTGSRGIPGQASPAFAMNRFIQTRSGRRSWCV